MKYNITYYITLIAMLLSLSGCDKYLDIVPKGQVIPENKEEYRALLNQGYNTFPKNKELLQMRGVQVTPNIDPYGHSGFPAYRNIYTWHDGADTQGETEEYSYYSLYTVIFYANSIILGVQPDDDDLSQLLGEAYLLRAYTYFELTNMYGPKYSAQTRDTKVVPINNEINIEQNFPRATLGQLYDQIESDLLQAEKYLKVTQWQQPQYKYRASIDALHALASRIYLYKSDWQRSLNEAQKALTISQALTDLRQSEDKEFKLPSHYQSPENIWAMEELFSMQIREYAFAAPDFYNSFSDQDLRKKLYFSELTDQNTWMSYPASGKFNGKNYRVTVRRAEVYLNAAEASARLGKSDEAKQYLMELISKRYTPEGVEAQKVALQPLTGEALISFILNERQHELGIEGHEWYDYKRTTQPALTKVVEGKEYHLQAGDARYVLRLPKSALASNPLLTE